MANPSTELINETQILIGRFDRNIARLQQRPVDLRVFFTIAHAYITKCIFRNIDLFTAPDPLMRLNRDFATTFLNAIEGQPHPGWQRAFKVCSGVGSAARSGFGGLAVMGPTVFEQCAGCMANVHINMDLRQALHRERGVDAQDYGNVYIFVVAGNAYAELWLRGRAKAAIVSTVGMIVGAKVSLDFKVWRNDVFEQSYGKSVPDPDPQFVSTVQGRGFAQSA